MRVASDIGGTFTDLIYLDEVTGEIGMTKASTTPHNFAIGVEDTLKKSGINVADTSFFVHGSTIIINALTERKGVKTGLITTRGFRDVLEITRANRPDIYNMYYTKPVPFVPRYLRLEVRERVNYKGEELEPLNEDDVRQAVGFFKREGVEAIAVCFLHSYANSDHEARCGELLRELLPDVPVTLSHEIIREWREYERTNTTVLNAYVQPIAVRYLDTLEKDLSEMGMGPVAHIMQSNGGIATFEVARQSPIRTCESGPVAGVIGAATIVVGKSARVHLKKGDVARLITATGGGWGNPYQRPVEAVQRDVRDGFITVEMAEKDYGRIIDPDTLEVTGVTKERS